MIWRHGECSLASWRAAEESFSEATFDVVCLSGRCISAEEYRFCAAMPPVHALPAMIDRLRTGVPIPCFAEFSDLPQLATMGRS